jgi:hypothetical protein
MGIILDKACLEFSETALKVGFITLEGLPSTEFPVLPFPNRWDIAALWSSDIEPVLCAYSTRGSDAGSILSGINIKQDKDKISVAATDGSRFRKPEKSGLIFP